MSSINYLSILKKAWSITWSNKYLWWFGFFIALTSSGSLFNYSSRNDTNAQQMNQQFADLLSQHAGWFLAGAVILLIIFLLLLIMRFLSRGALIKSIEKHSKNEPSTFSAGLREGKKYFWRVLLISFLIQAAVMAVALLIITPIAFLFMTKSYILGVLLTLAGIVIILPLMVLAFFLANYSLIYAVLGDLSIADAIENGYNLFRKHIWTSILMALIFIPIAIALLIGTLFIIFFLAIIFFVLGLIAFLLFNKIGAAVILVLVIILFLLIFLGVRSVYETFSQAAWIFFFREIASPKVAEAVAEAVPEVEPVVTPDPANC
jgi:hypothetical protein